MPDDRQATLLALVQAAGLPPEEPVIGWLRYTEDESEPLPAGLQLEVAEDEEVLLMPGGRVRDQVLPGGRVLVTDERNPRATRSQMYDAARPGQPRTTRARRPEGSGPGCGAGQASARGGIATSGSSGPISSRNGG